MQGNENIQRRRFPRRQFKHSVGLLFLGKYHIVSGLEIGEGGMLFECPQALIQNQHVVINFFVPERSFVTVTGEVLYSKPEGTEQKISVGVKFISLPFESKRMIRDYIAEKTSAEEEAA
jgi:hypothetical protein